MTSCSGQMLEESDQKISFDLFKIPKKGAKPKIDLKMTLDDI